ncbi:Uncharacterised protein [Streptococcus criceti]|nr:hypothetical protein [Streptococcus criceti]SUN43129.1 Uncharacterised protein [Streptococcus criceti]
MRIIFTNLITTVIGAFIGGLFSLWIVKIQLQAKENEKKAEQANKIAAWIDIESLVSENAQHLVLRNASDLPVYDVLILVVNNRTPKDYKEIQPKDFISFKIYSLLEPAEKTDGVRTGGKASGGQRPMVAILFTDSLMQHWYRNQFGKLMLLSDAEYNALIKNLGFRPPL